MAANSSSSATTNAQPEAFTPNSTGHPHPRTHSRLDIFSVEARRRLGAEFERAHYHRLENGVLVLGMSDAEHRARIEAAMVRPDPPRRVDAVIDLQE